MFHLKIQPQYKYNSTGICNTSVIFLVVFVCQIHWVKGVYTHIHTHKYKKLYFSFCLSLSLILNIHVCSEADWERNKTSLELLAKHLPDTATELQ
jgi:hypothetical protein